MEYQEEEGIMAVMVQSLLAVRVVLVLSLLNTLIPL